MSSWIFAEIMEFRQKIDELLDFQIMFGRNTQFNNVICIFRSKFDIQFRFQLETSGQLINPFVTQTNRNRFVVGCCIWLHMLCAYIMEEQTQVKEVPLSKFPNEHVQAKVPRLEFRSRSSQATHPKLNLASYSYQAQFLSQIIQAKVPKPNSPN